MSFFYNLNKTLDAIREKPELKHGQLNERDLKSASTSALKAAASKDAKADKDSGVSPQYSTKQVKDELKKRGVEEGLGDAVKQVGSMAKKLGQKAITTLGHGDDAEMLRDLQRKMGMPQTGMKPGAEPNPKQVKEGEAEDKLLAAKIRKMLPAYHKRMEPEDAYQEVAEYLGISLERLYDVLELDEGVDKQAFAALAPPKDKITFADKIAGAKKEVDEMLGDVAAEAMKSALSGGQKKLDKNNNGKLDANDFAMLRKGGKKQVADEGWDDMLKDVERRRGATKKGEVIHGHKHDITDTGTGRRVQRRTDPNTGYSVGADADDKPADGEKRGRGRPKKADKAPERVTAKATKHKGGRKVKEVDEGAGEGNDLVKLSKVIASCKTPDQLKVAQQMANNFLAKHVKGGISNIRSDVRRRNDVDDTLQQKNRELQGGQELEEKAVSKKQQKFMGMVHATQKGEKAPSKEVAKVAKTMKKADAKDFASTKQKGLPEKAPKKKEKTEEAGGTKTPTASSGFSFGQGIYDSMNFELEQMISESMSINVSSSTEGGQNITVTASDEDAIKLAGLLKSAGLGGDSEGYGGTGYKSACGCDAGADCSCGEEEMDEAAPAVSNNKPNWPTNQETAQDNLEYSGGLNKPKSTGQTTVPVIAGQDGRTSSYAEEEQDAIKRMMEMAGIKEAKAKPDFLDADKDGNKKEPMKAALKDKDADKVDESIFALTNQWKAYKG